MTQREVLDLLDSIMPDIIRSGNPEESMMKCAKANNLSVAQLEKLGHVFNTMKTNVALTKMASRGESFTIVDVPSMINNYTTFDPGKELSAKNKEVHKKVNKITKFAGGSKLPTFDNMFTEKDALMSKDGVQFELEDNDWKAVQGIKPDYDIMHKSASADVDGMDWETYDKYQEYTKRAEDGFRQVAFDAQQDVQDLCKEVFNKFAFKADRWHEAVEDVFYTFGEKAASAVASIEDYMAQRGLKFSVIDMTKQAGLNGLVEDRHGVVQVVEDIMCLNDIREQALGELEKLAMPQKNNNAPKQKSTASRNLPPAGFKVKTKNTKRWPSPTPTDKLVDAIEEAKDRSSASMPKLPTIPMSRVLDSIDKLPEKGVRTIAALDELVGGNTKEDKKYLEDSTAKSKRQIALEELVLLDPVISSADQSKVNSIYETISMISPTFASDSNLLGPAIKEALQYGSVPVQMVTNLAKAEETLASIAAKKKLTESKGGSSYE